MNTLNVGLIQEHLRLFAMDRDWDQFHSVKNLAMALSVESAELVEIFQWMSEEQSAQVKNEPKNLERVKEEVADVLLYLLRLADKLEIDLEPAVWAKLEKNALKYPVEKSKGSSKKYDEI
jgi:dCTP diphosphatase